MDWLLVDEWGKFESDVKVRAIIAFRLFLTLSMTGFSIKSVDLNGRYGSQRLLSTIGQDLRLPVKG